MVEDLTNMLDSYASVMDGQDHLNLVSGYLNYEQILDQYVNASKEYEGVDHYMFSAGKMSSNSGIRLY